MDKEPLTYKQAMHELRKAHKGLRKQASRIKQLQARLEEERYWRGQYFLAMMSMAGHVWIEPYDGWHPRVQYWIDSYKRKHQNEQ